MHVANHETLLITVASLSFATLLFMFIYLVYADEDSYEKKDGDNDELISRSVLLARAIGYDNISHLRAFRAGSFLMVTLPTAWRMHRKREQQMEAAKAKIVEE